MISATLLGLSVSKPVTYTGLSKPFVHHILHVRARKVQRRSTWYKRWNLGAQQFRVIVHRANTHLREEHAELSSQFDWFFFF